MSSPGQGTIVGLREHVGDPEMQTQRRTNGNQGRPPAIWIGCKLTISHLYSPDQPPNLGVKKIKSPRVQDDLPGIFVPSASHAPSCYPFSSIPYPGFTSASALHLLNSSWFLLVTWLWASWMDWKVQVSETVLQWAPREKGSLDTFRTESTFLEAFFS